MHRIIATLAALVVSAAPLAAQAPPSSNFNSGIKLRGAFHVNRSAVETGSELPNQEQGYGAGIEMNGRHIGLGVYGYTAGLAREFDAQTTPLIVVAEANYFLPINFIRLAPYAGIHTGLGRFDRSYFEKPYVPRPQDGIGELGYQVGLRFKPIPLISVDAQWRHQSGFAAASQDASLERNQVLVGVVLF